MAIDQDPRNLVGKGDSDKGSAQILPSLSLEEPEKTSFFAKLSRRKLALGLAGSGVAVATGAFAIQKMIEHQGQQEKAIRPLFPAQTDGPQTLTPRAQLGHLLRRGGFGATAEELAKYEKGTYEQAVDSLIRYQQTPDTDLEQRLKDVELDLSNPVDQQRWWLLRMAWTKRPLLEKMTLFWHGLLTSSFRKVGGADAYPRMIVQNEFLRDHAFDTYDTILKGISTDSAMLVYLDLTRSRKATPNENYARELMELFTIGVGNYTQQDVTQVALALTGWHVVGNDSKSTFNAKDFNASEKTILNQKGNFGLDDVIQILTNHPATPKLLSRKLFSFFAHENPDDADLQPLIDAYNQSNHNMGAVMRALFLSPQFCSSQSYRNRIKSPIEFMIGVYRALGADANNEGLPGFSTALGQTVFNPPNVAGWPGDKVSGNWMNSGTWMLRANFVALLLYGSKKTASGPYSAFDIQNVVKVNNIDSPERFVDYFATYLLDDELYDERRAQFIEYFKTTDSSATTITLTNGQSYPLNRVRGTLYLMMASPDYQFN